MTTVRDPLDRVVGAKAAKALGWHVTMFDGQGSPRTENTGLLDAVALPDLQRDRVEAFQQIGQAARDGVIDAQFVDHLRLLLIAFADSMRPRRAAGKRQVRQLGC